VARGGPYFTALPDIDEPRQGAGRGSRTAKRRRSDAPPVSSSSYTTSDVRPDLGARLSFTRRARGWRVGLGLITGWAVLGPYEDVRLKSR